MNELLNVEERIKLDRFTPRPYQQEILNALQRGYKKLIICLPRRSGKDFLAWQIAVKQCLFKVCLVQYVLPTYKQARDCVFEAIDFDGNKFLDYIPKSAILKINLSEQKIIFKNNSILHCIGGDTHDTSIRGTNPYMVVLSEFAYMKPDIYDTVRPILAANGGTVIFLSTPFGKNFFFFMLQMAKEIPDWYVMHKKTSEIHHIPEHILEQERREMSEDKYQEQYECSFERGVDGSFYGKDIESLKQRGQITNVAWDPGLLVHVAIDIGVNDPTTMIFFSVVGEGTIIRIFDCYSNTGLGLDHYAHYLQSKPYRYGKLFAPHDIMVREYSGGITRWEKAKQLDIKFDVLPQIGLLDGIENVRTHFPKFWIDKENCRSLINALENYRREFDEKNNCYHPKPLARNWANHYADAVRYMCQAIYRTKKGLTSEEFERKKAEMTYGPNNFKQQIFNRDPRYDR